MEGGAITAKRLEGKVAVITGGASGFGSSTARLFVQHGAKVVIADIQDDLGHSLCQELGSDYHNITFVHCDVTNEDDVRNAVDTAVSKYGKLDIMFNNAGITGNFSKSIFDTDNEDFKRVFDVNVFGGFLGAKHAARVMIPAKTGTILFSASVASVVGGETPHAYTTSKHAVVGGETPHAYTTSKHAVVGLMKNLCVELGRFGIRVNCISPFYVDTPMTRKALGMEEGVFKQLVGKASNLKGVVLTAEDVAQAALYLAGDESRYVSGLNLLIDGGHTTTNPAFLHAMATATER